MSSVAYPVVIEQAPNNLSAYVPDLPGCIAVGDTESEVIESIRESIAIYIEELRARGEPIPPPTPRPKVVTVEVDGAARSDVGSR